MIVLFPAPFSQTRAIRSPGLMVKERCSITGDAELGYEKLTFRNSIVGGIFATI